MLCIRFCPQEWHSHSLHPKNLLLVDEELDTYVIHLSRTRFLISEDQLHTVDGSRASNPSSAVIYWALFFPKMMENAEMDSTCISTSWDSALKLCIGHCFWDVTIIAHTNLFWNMWMQLSFYLYSTYWLDFIFHIVWIRLPLAWDRLESWLQVGTFTGGGSRDVSLVGPSSTMNTAAMPIERWNS